MSKTAIFGTLAAGAGLTAMVLALMGSASPYVTVAQAKTHSQENLHLAGDIIKPSLMVRPREGTVRFDLRDDKGDIIPVVYKGNAPANMGEATRVVAVGKVENGTFQSHKLLLKCPSKYEGTEKPGAKG